MLSAKLTALKFAWPFAILILLSHVKHISLQATSAFCNQFESPADGWQLNAWKLSSATRPTPDIQHSSNFAWITNTQAEKLISSAVVFNKGDVVKFEYYLSSSEADINNALMVYVNDLDSSTLFPLNTYLDTKGSWTSETFTCDTNNQFCLSYPCNGNVVWESSYASGDVTVAVDNLQLNSGCDNTASCCKFEEATLCGYSNDAANGDYNWQWSHATPTALVPPIDGEFVWWQLDGGNAAAVASTFRSADIVMYPNSTVSLKYYANILVTQKSTLQIIFHNANPDYTSQFVSVVFGSNREWVDLTTLCTDADTKCCVLANGCHGSLEFAVTADPDAHSVFAIDNVQIDNECVVQLY